MKINGWSHKHKTHFLKGESNPLPRIDNNYFYMSEEGRGIREIIKRKQLDSRQDTDLIRILNGGILRAWLPKDIIQFKAI